jgi:hypothetical protein
MPASRNAGIIEQAYCSGRIAYKKALIRQNESGALAVHRIKRGSLMTMSENERRKELGDWGEQKAIELLRRQGSGFINVKDINAETANHPFGDVFAGRVNSHACVIGVKTRNKYQASGPLNATYNVRKKGFDIDAIGKRYNAQLAWVAIQVIPEVQTFNAYFGTIDQIQEAKERFSIPMKAHETLRYQRLGAKDEFDPVIRKEWSNGGYPLAKARGLL